MKRVRNVSGVLIAVILLLVVYILGGVFLSYRRQPEVSKAYRSSFHPEDCYSDQVSCDRACIIEDNDEALRMRLKMIEQARERVVLSTFEFRADKSGMDMMAALLAAADRGVRVQIISDGFPAMLRMNRSPYFHGLAAAENVEIRVYNPLNLLVPWKTMGRLHCKYVIVDDSLYLLGGRNTYDYFLTTTGHINYDRDVLVITSDPSNPESSIHQLEKYYRSIWESEDCRTLKGWSEEKTSEAMGELRARYRQIRSDIPDLGQRPDYQGMTCEVNRITILSNPIHIRPKEPWVFYALTEIMKYSQGEISIHTPYIICNDYMYDSFRAVCDSNPDTYLLTNSAANNGNPFGASDYMRNRGKLLDAGLKIYEFEGGSSYHGKSICIGDRLAVVGSFNMDMRSVYLDTELMMVIDSVGVNRQLREIMDTYEAQSVLVLDETHTQIPENVTPQEFKEDSLKQIDLLKHFSWLRFLI